VTPQWAEDIGADGFAEDAANAVIVAKKLLGK
jgi:methanogenic corrinoid protein MtbC1